MRGQDTKLSSVSIYDFMILMAAMAVFANSLRVTTSLSGPLQDLRFVRFLLTSTVLGVVVCLLGCCRAAVCFIAVLGLACLGAAIVGWLSSGRTDGWRLASFHHGAILVSDSAEIPILC